MQMFLLQKGVKSRMKIELELQSPILNEDNFVAIFSSSAVNFDSDDHSENARFRKLLFSKKEYSWAYADAIFPDGNIIEQAFVVILGGK